MEASTLNHTETPRTPTQQPNSADPTYQPDITVQGVLDSEPAYEYGRPHGVGLRRSEVGLPAGWEGVSSGRVTSSRAGQVIEGLDVSVESGVAILVQHDDVTVRYNRIRHGGGANGIEISSNATGTVVEFNELDGLGEVLGNYGSAGVQGGTNATIRRNYFSNGRVGGTAFETGTVVVENWVENLTIANGSHGNSFSYHGAGSGGVQFLRNRTVASDSSGLAFYARHGPVRSSTIKDNLIVGDGMGFGIYGGRTFDHHPGNRDIRIEGNRFEGRFGWPQVLGEGTNAGVDLSRPGNTFTNNRWVDSTTDLPPRCGVTQDRCEAGAVPHLVD